MSDVRNEEKCDFELCDRDSCRRVYTTQGLRRISLGQRVRERVLQVWQGVAKLELYDCGLCGSHRSAAVGQHVGSRDQDGGAGQCAERQHVELLQVQEDECLRDGRGGLGRKLMR